MEKGNTASVDFNDANFEHYDAWCYPYTKFQILQRIPPDDPIDITTDIEGVESYYSVNWVEEYSIPEEYLNLFEVENRYEYLSDDTIWIEDLYVITATFEWD